MYKRIKSLLAGVIVAGLLTTGCKVPALTESRSVLLPPATYGNIATDTTNTATLHWRQFFSDPYLVSLIDTALKRNLELSNTLQEIQIARNEVRLRQTPLLPTVSGRIGMGVEKVGRYTSQGAGDASTEIKPGKEVPDPLPDISAGVYANWELDIWKKLRHAKQAAINRYLATIEGKNFVLTNLIAEVARSYYELLALDNQLEIVTQTIGLQKNGLEIVKVQKEAARVTELAVQKFRAEVLHSQRLEFDLRQRIRETENRINLLLGRYSGAITRSSRPLMDLVPPSITTGIPSQLLLNRPDIQQAELALAAAKLDVKVARAEFYPSLGLSAALGIQAFRPSYLAKLPESLLYSLAGDLAGPLINRTAIKAEYYSASARQLQALYNYQQHLLNGYLEVATQLSKIENLGKQYDLQAREVAVLTQSISIANDLFKSARADYLEVLLTQRDALSAKLELVETKKEQLNTAVTVYRDLGGGWQ